MSHSHHTFHHPKNRNQNTDCYKHYQHMVSASVVYQHTLHHYIFGHFHNYKSAKTHYHIDYNHDHLHYPHNIPSFHVVFHHNSHTAHTPNIVDHLGKSPFPGSSPNQFALHQYIPPRTSHKLLHWHKLRYLHRLRNTI